MHLYSIIDQYKIKYKYKILSCSLLALPSVFHQGRDIWRQTLKACHVKTAAERGLEKKKNLNPEMNK